MTQPNFTLAEVLPVYGLVLGMFAVPLLISLTIVLVLGKKRDVKWTVDEFLFLPAPLLVWLCLLAVKPKSPENILEAFFIGMISGLILFPRLFLPAETPRKRFLISYVSALIASLATVIIYLFVPAVK